MTPDDLRAIFYNAFDGLHVYDYVANSKVCANSIDGFISDLINSTINSVAFFSDLTRIEFEHATFNFTNALGMLSPIMRKCYVVGGSID